jgi:alpha-beta hydrolase superfamily lysophospholipase
MKTTDLQWKTKDGVDIHAVCWEPDNGEIKAVINLVHGMGEHIRRYDHVARFFTEKGFVIVGFDHRGHGKSGGPRGHIPSYDAILDDVELLLKKSSERYPHKPAFIYAHSMGAGVTANLLIRRNPDIKGALLSAPYFRLSFQQPAIKLWLGRVTQNLIPKLTLPTGLNADHISRDKKEVAKYKSDPLVHDKVSAMMGISLVDAGEYALAHANELKVPVLALHGSADQLTDCNATKEFAAKAGKLVQLKIYEGLYHEIHNEPEQQTVLNDALQWFESLL